ncbi:MAG: hypothetical protein H6518_06560 [Microthrixaceae bacterium]|nr:hypothetical protein [Microthrixaceae bacterium]
MIGLAVVTVLVLGFLAFRSSFASDEPARLDEADAYLAAWGEGDFATMAAGVAQPPPEFTALHQQMLASLQVREAAYEAGEAEVDGDRATVPFTAELTLGGLGVWRYESALNLVRGDDGWKVDWTPATLHPDLQQGERFARTRTAPSRAAIVDRNGLPLADGTAPLIVGTTGPATPEQAAALGPLVEAGDTVGTQGLQARYNDVLSGEPSGQVQIIGASGVPEVVHVFPGADGEPLTTTIDPVVQAAAENAIAVASGPAAFVAIESDTGEVLAVGNSPSDGLNRPISGAYPPGSTFKVVTSNALLGVGVDPDVNVTCPATANGFGNYAGESFGTIPFREAFYRSCNTSFIIQTGLLPEGALEASAEQFGFNTPYDIGIDSVGGSFPSPESQAELLAASIGQGKVTASPLHMASVAAAIDDGHWRAPTLIHGDQAPERPAPVDLDPDVVADIDTMMHEVVTEGTGYNAEVAGRDVAGKTGTAEFGAEDPPETHAWFIGFSDGIAFACLVEGGGSGGSVAAPVAGRFVAALPAPPPPTTTTTGGDDG